MQPIHDWVNEKNGQIVFTDEEQFKKEFHAELDGKCWKALIKRREAGQARFIPKERLPLIKKKDIVSDDPHILALCMASGTKLLLTDDGDLQLDFIRLIDGGKLYVPDPDEVDEKNEHEGSKELLTPDTCPID